MRQSWLWTFAIVVICVVIAFFTVDQRQSILKRGGLNSPSVSPSPTSSLDQSPVPSPTPIFDLNDINPTFRQLSQEIYTTIKSNTRPKYFSTDKDGYVWWISESGYNIISNGVPSLSAEFVCEQRDNHTYIEAGQVLPSLIKSIMTKYGYTLNEINSSKSLEDNQFYDYVQAYEKGNNKCTLTLNYFECSEESPVEFTSPITFACTDKYSSNREIQDPILHDLNITKAIIHIKKQVDNYAMINVNYRRTGHYVIAVKQDGHWVEIHGGQDIPPCDVMQKYSVPKEIYSSCVGGEKGTVIYN